MAVEKLALYPADSLHISKTLNDTCGELFNVFFWFYSAKSLKQQSTDRNITLAEDVDHIVMAVEKLALYPADSLHISKTLNPFDIIITICLNCDNYQCTNPLNSILI
jgi:hypothetical protein